MFITFEGIEGSGKSTQIELLYKVLKQVHFDVEVTREPGWGAIGKLIRRIILENPNLDLDPFAELSLFCADRAQHVRDYIRPMLNKGKVVLCDRFSDSTVAYQGFGREINPDFVKQMASNSSLGLIPNVTFLLDISVSTALSRIVERPGRNKIDDESFDFHTRVKKAYLDIAKQNTNRVYLVDGEQDTKIVHENIKSILSSNYSIFSRLSRK